MPSPGVRIDRPTSDFPELVVTVPDRWPYIKLAPLYDVHHGHELHAGKMFLRDMDRMSREPYLLTFNGGDLIENAVLGSPGIFSQTDKPHDQFDAAARILKPIRDKMIFAIPGNHEARTYRFTGFDLGRAFADSLGIEYFPDYCFCTIHWRGNRFRLAAHHGTGAAQTAGGQRNAARKDMPWLKADIYWTGHLHQPIADLAYQVDYDSVGRMYSRSSLVIISPSYLRYFGGYAAQKRYAPGVIGLTPVTLYPDGRMEASVIARGKRL